MTIEAGAGKELPLETFVGVALLQAILGIAIRADAKALRCARALTGKLHGNGFWEECWADVGDRLS